MREPSLMNGCCKRQTWAAGLSSFFRQVVLAEVHRRHGGYLHGNVMGQGAEFVGARHEVGFATQLNHGAHAPSGVYVGFDQPLRRFPVGPFGGLFKAFLAQGFSRALQVAAGVFQRVFAIADSGARLVAQGFD